MNYPIEVENWQARWAMHNLAAQGVPIAGHGPHPSTPGIYVIVVNVADEAPAPAWRDAPTTPRRRRPSVSWRGMVQLLCVLVIVGGLGYLGFTMFAGGTFPTLGEMMGQVEGEPVVERTGFRWPWESETVSAPKVQPQDNAWQWPWESAAGAAADVAQGITNGLMLVGALLVLGVGLWVVGKARRGIK